MLKTIVQLVIASMLTGPAMARAEVLINGAGASFPYPIYSKWFSEYGKAHPNVKINYQSFFIHLRINYYTK